MKEIRIYYECLEQVEHFIKPILESSEEFQKSLFEIKLIKLTGNYEVYSENVAKVVFLKDPDILITIVENKIEYPLFQLEISTAVYTEDHELQRFDGIIASVESNCIYGKLSPLSKKSINAHGGNTKFNHITSYSIIYKNHKVMSYHFDWPCNANGSVVVNDDYLSCPQQIASLESFLKCLMKFASKEFKPSNWILAFENSLLEIQHFIDWNKELEAFELQDITKLKTSRVEWKESENVFHFKFNRFGHAMDPERGMLAYYGTLNSSVISKMIFDIDIEAWFKTVSNEKNIREYIKSNGLNNTNDFLKMFVLAAGLHNNNDFVKIADSFSSTSGTIEIDLSEFVSNNFYSVNKPLRIIFRFSKEFHVYDNKENLQVKFHWKFNVAPFDFSKFPAVTPLSKRTYLDEDFVTYICVHNVLRENAYKLIAVSYPGAQGDRVALDDTEEGRTRTRKYIDIISYLPKSHTSIQENKGYYQRGEIQGAIDKIALYKTDETHIKSVETILDFFDKEAPKVFKIGIGFWASKRFTLAKIQELSLEELDYFVYIKSDISEWIIYSTGENPLFKKTSGVINLPDTYEVAEESNQLKIFESS